MLLQSIINSKKENEKGLWGEKNIKIHKGEDHFRKKSLSGRKNWGEVCKKVAVYKNGYNNASYLFTYISLWCDFATTYIQKWNSFLSLALAIQLAFANWTIARKTTSRGLKVLMFRDLSCLAAWNPLCIQVLTSPWGIRDQENCGNSGGSHPTWGLTHVNEFMESNQGISKGYLSQHTQSWEIINICGFNLRWSQRKWVWSVPEFTSIT